MVSYAEEVNYWQSSQTSSDVWIEKAKKEIIRAEGIVRAEGFGSDRQGRAAYMIAFSFEEERFKAVWPVLPTKTGNERAARIQAATMLFHDVKSRCITAKMLGFRAAFFGYWLLPSGQSALEVAAPELVAAIPRLLTGGCDE